MHAITARENAESLDAIALQNMANSSEAMFQRRRRILREARTIIHEDGLEMLNMRELSKRADVSTKTIYNAFESKENVIALAIQTYFLQFFTHIRFDEADTSFEGAFGRQVTSTLRDLDVPNYMRAVTMLYFSATLEQSIRTVLIDLATRSWVAWLHKVEDQRELQPSVIVRELLNDLSNIQYACIQEWSSGSIDNELFVIRSLSSVLMLLMGACTGSALAQLQTAFLSLRSDPAYREALLSAGRARIAAAVAAVGAPRSRRRPAPMADTV